MSWVVMADGRLTYSWRTRMNWKCKQRRGKGHTVYHNCSTLYSVSQLQHTVSCNFSSPLFL